jgi:integrase
MPSLRKVPRSPFWIACFRDAEGRQYNRSTKKRDKGSAAAVALEFERMAGGWLAENPTVSAVFDLASSLSERMGQPLEVVTVAQEFRAYAAGLESKSDSTRQRYAQIVREFLGFLGVDGEKKLGALAAREILAFRDSRLRAGLSPSSVDFELKMIRSVLKRAMLAGRIPSNPALNVPLLNRKGAVRSVFEPEQVRALLMACEGFRRRGQDAGADWRGAMLVAFYTGARLSDVANLRWQNVDLEKKILRYSEKKKRFATEILVPLHDELEAHLIGLSAPDDPETFLFPALAGRITGGANGLSREFVMLMSRAGIERRVIRAGAGSGKGRNIFDLGEHSFRHSFNSHLSRAGVPEDVRQRLCGHESKEVSRRYTHHEIESLRGAVAKLPPVSAFPARQSSRRAGKNRKGARGA